MAQQISIAYTDYVTSFRNARGMTSDAAKRTRKDTWAAIRARFAIPASVKLKVELDHNRNGDQFVLKDKATNTPLYAENGRFVSVGAPVGATGATNTPANTTQDVVRVISSSATVRYIRVGVHNLSQLADDYSIDSDDDGVDIVNMADAGRVAYDKDTDSVLIRLG